MINYETLLSSYDDKLTLLQWLKKVEAALKDASAVSFKVNKRGDATLTFSVVFEDGSELETDPIILQQGESVQGAAIRDGHLILTLTNGDDLDAGNLGAVSGFSINASQHLIVAYQNGATQDLGAIFTGDVSITGNLAAAAVKTASLTSDEAEISAQKPVVEVMNGYSLDSTLSIEGLTIENVYTSASKNGNKLTLVSFLKLTRTANTTGYGYVTKFEIPTEVGAKLFPYSLGSLGAVIENKVIQAFSDRTAYKDLILLVTKPYNSAIYFLVYNLNDLDLNVEYVARFEVTLLLSDNLGA